MRTEEGDDIMNDTAYEEAKNLLKKYIGTTGVRQAAPRTCSCCCSSHGGGKARYQDKAKKK